MPTKKTTSRPSEPETVPQDAFGIWGSKIAVKAVFDTKEEAIESLQDMERLCIESSYDQEPTHPGAPQAAARQVQALANVTRKLVASEFKRPKQPLDLEAMVTAERLELDRGHAAAVQAERPKTELEIEREEAEAKREAPAPEE